MNVRESSKAVFLSFPCPRTRTADTRWNFSTLFSRLCVKFHSSPRSLAGYPPYVSPSSSISSPSLLANSRDIHPSVVRLAPFCEQSGRQDKYGKRGAGMRSAPRRRRRRGFRNNTIISRNHPTVPPRNRYLSRSYEARLNLSEVVSRERNILSPR